LYIKKAKNYKCFIGEKLKWKEIARYKMPALEHKNATKLKCKNAQKIKNPPNTPIF